MLVGTLVSASCMVSTLTAPSSTAYWPKGVFAPLRPLEHRLARDEAGLVPAFVRVAELGLVERPDAQQQLELVTQVGPHHLWPVSCDRKRHLALGEGAESVAHRLLVRQRLRQQVRRRADLEHDLGLGDLAHQPPVLGGEDAVADAIRPKGRDDLADLGDPVLTALLADVDRDAEAGLARLLDEGQQLAVGVGPGAVGARAGDVDANDPARRVADRLL